MENQVLFQDYSDARAHLICRLIRQRDTEGMRGVPYVQAFGDLAVIPCLYEKNRDGTALSCPVSFRQAQRWGICQERLVEDACTNMEMLLPPRLYRLDDLMKSPITGSIRDVLLGLLRKQFREVRETVLDQVAQALTIRLAQKFRSESTLKPMWVLGNDDWMYGASSLLFSGILEEFSGRTGGNFFILPSSIHEVILLPEGGGESRDQLYEMVASANRHMADRAKILSDSVYYFDKNKMEIRTL